MKYAPVAAATAALFLGSVAVAESPVVLKVRAAVNAIDAKVGSLNKAEVEVNLQGDDGVHKIVSDQNAEVVSITHWAASGGGRVKAKATFAGEFEGTDALFYWSVDRNLVQKPLFAYMHKTYRDNNNKTKRTEDLRCYFENGKVKVFRVGTRDVSVTDRRCKAVAKSMKDIIQYITPGD